MAGHFVKAINTPVNGNPLARLHGIWGLGQAARIHGLTELVAGLVPLLGHPDDEVVCQATRVMSEHGIAAAAEPLMGLLTHESDRVKYFAAMALGRLNHKAAIGPICDVLRANADRDVFLRHACVMGLTWMDDPNAVFRFGADADRSVRIGVLLTLRRHKDPSVALFLADPDPFLVEEAARAIYDERIEGAMPALAAVLTIAPDGSESLVRRAMAACLDVGGATEAELLADVAGNTDLEESTRVIALSMLEQWPAPALREPVQGFYRELAPRDASVAKVALEPIVESLISSTGRVQRGGLKLASVYGFALDSASYRAIAADGGSAAENRIEALKNLAGDDAKGNEEFFAGLLDDREALVRAESARLLAGTNPGKALQAIQKAFSNKSGKAEVERQLAFGTLASMESKEADAVLGEWMKKLVKGPKGVALPLQLDLLNAARKRLPASVKAYEAGLPTDDLLAKHRPTMKGGNAKRGMDVFASAVAQCSRCHAVEDGHEEAMAGPNLHGVATRFDREYILESLVNPGAKVADGFATISVTKKDKSVVVGILKSETEKDLTLWIEGKGNVVIPLGEIAERSQPVSGMPPMALVLSPEQLRDLMAYLWTLKSR